MTPSPPSPFRPSLAHLWAKLSRTQKLATTALLSLLLLAALLAAKPLLNAARTWRAETLCRTALALQNEGRLPDALAKAHAAYQLAPAHSPVARTLAELYEAVHPFRARDLWNALLADPSARDSDRLRAADFFIRSGFLNDASAALQPLLQHPPFSASTCEAIARLAFAQGDWVASESWATRGMAANPEDPVRLRLAQLITQAGWAQGGRARQEALATALTLARQTGTQALDTLAWLAAQTDLSPEQASQLLETLRNLGAANTLAAADARLRQNPKDAPAIFAEIVATRKKDDPAALAETGRWLNQRGGSEAVLELIPPSTAASRRDLFLIRADAMALAKRWDDLEKLLQDPSIPLERVFVRAFQFRVALAQGHENQALVFWERALQETNRQPDLLWYLASYAERLGRLDQAEAAYRRLAQDAGAARLAHLAWVRLLESSGQTERLRTLMIEIAARYPNEPAPRNDLLYLDLLTGQPAQPRLEDAQRQVTNQPNVGAYRVTLALALLKLGRPSEALPLFEGFPPPEEWPPGWRAVYAAVLDAHGQKDRARQLTASIPRDLLKPEERALLPR